MNFNRLGIQYFVERGKRDAGRLHRNAVTAIDKLVAPAIAGLSSQNDVGGVLVPTTTYYVTAAARNRWGPTMAPVPASIVLGAATTAVRLPLAQVPGADAYDLFLSTDASPKWVSTITEAQRATGGIITGVGSAPSAGGAANSIDIGVVGTQVAAGAAPFLWNNAYTPAVVSPLDCTGFSRAHLLVKLAVNDLRVAPGLTLVPFLNNQVSAADWFQGAPSQWAVLAADGQALCQDFWIDVDGCTGLAMLVGAIAGNGAAASVWVELS